MKVIGRDVLKGAARRNKPLRSWIELWIATIVNSNWNEINDVRKAYPSADGVRLSSGTIVTVFNVKGNNYRLLTWIDFEAKVVEALALITHAEYSKEQWKWRY